MKATPRGTLLAALAVLLLDGCSSGCSGRAPKASVADASATATSTRASTATSTSAAVDEQRPRQRYRAPVVYLDGTPLAVLSFGELPPGLETRWTLLEDQRKVRRFLIADYLRALGVDLAKVKEVHAYGGRERIAVIKGAELRRFEKKLLFSFTQSDKGVPRLHWPGEGFETNDAIDKVVALTVYVTRLPPIWNPESWSLELEGRAVEGIPYATTEVRGGTRVYVDGRLAGFIKRNGVDMNALVPGSAEGGRPRYALLGQLATLGIRLEAMKSVDLIYEDVPLARLPAKDLLGADFALLEKSGGTIELRPPEKQVTAILLYDRQAPPDLTRR